MFPPAASGNVLSLHAEWFDLVLATAAARAVPPSFGKAVFEEGHGGHNLRGRSVSMRRAPFLHPQWRESLSIFIVLSAHRPRFD